jgi:hypothetical protein
MGVRAQTRWVWHVPRKKMPNFEDALISTRRGLPAVWARVHTVLERLRRTRDFVFYDLVQTSLTTGDAVVATLRGGCAGGVVDARGVGVVGIHAAAGRSFRGHTFHDRGLRAHVPRSLSVADQHVGRSWQLHTRRCLPAPPLLVVMRERETGETALRKLVACIQTHGWAGPRSTQQRVLAPLCLFSLVAAVEGEGCW